MPLPPTVFLLLFVFVLYTASSSRMLAPAVAAAAVARPAAKIFKALTTREGLGFIVHRSFGGPHLPRGLSPFIMLDHMDNVYEPGKAILTGEHPHRGFITVTYLLQGEVEHRDSMGNHGLLRPGDCQFMLAGSGIIHSEKPSAAYKAAGGALEGFQLWMRLPERLQMSTPQYFDATKDTIPVVTRDGVTCRVIAGEALGATGPITPPVPLQYLHYIVQPGATLTHAVPAAWNAAIYLFHGKSARLHQSAQNVTLANREMVVFDHDDGAIQLSVDADAGEATHLMLMAGEVIDEPLFWRGPFALASQAALDQAWSDYYSGNLVREKGVMKLEGHHSEAFKPGDTIFE